MDKLDFSYEISEERLRAYAAIPLLDRLRWLDEVRRFTLMARQGQAMSETAMSSGSVAPKEPG